MAKELNPLLKDLLDISAKRDSEADRALDHIESEKEKRVAEVTKKLEAANKDLEEIKSQIEQQLASLPITQHSTGEHAKGIKNVDRLTERATWQEKRIEKIKQHVSKIESGAEDEKLEVEWPIINRANQSMMTLTDKSAREGRIIGLKRNPTLIDEASFEYRSKTMSDTVYQKNNKIALDIIKTKQDDMEKNFESGESQEIKDAKNKELVEDISIQERTIAKNSLMIGMSSRNRTSDKYIDQFANDISQKVQLEKEAEQVRKDNKSGEFKQNINESEKKIAAQSARMDELKQKEISGTSSKEEIEKNAQEYDALAEARRNEILAHKKMTDVLNESVRQTKELNNKSEMDRTKLINIANAMQIGAGALGHGLVTMPMREMQLQSRFADVANDQYKNMVGASKGDVDSIYDLLATQGSVDGAKDIGKTAGGLGAISSALNFGVGMLSLTNPGTAATGGTGVSLVAGGLTAAADAAAGHTRAQAELAAHQAKMELMRKLTYVQREHVKAAIKQDFGATEIGRYAGIEGMRKLQTQMTDPEVLKRAASMGVSPDRLLSTTGMAVQALGGADNVDMGKLRGAEKLGLGTIEQNISRQAKLQESGGNQQDLFAILSSAVETGLNNSKAIDQMVESTTSLAARSAAMGINTATTQQSELYKTIGDSVSKGLMTQEQAINTATDANRTRDEITGSKELNIANVLEYQQLKSTLPNLDEWQTATLASTEFSSLKALQNETDPKKKQGMADKLGLGDVLYNKKGEFQSDALQKTMDIAQRAQLRATRGKGRFDNITEKDDDFIMNMAKKGDLTSANLKEQNPKAFHDLMRSLKQVGQEPDSFINQLNGKDFKPGNIQKTLEEASKKTPDGKSGMELNAAELAAKETIEGKKTLDKSGGVQELMKAIGDTLQKTLGGDGMKDSEKWATKAAKDFNLSLTPFTENFGKSVDAFKIAVDSFAKGADRPGYGIFPNMSTENKSKFSSFGGDGTRAVPGIGK